MPDVPKAAHALSLVLLLDEIPVGMKVDHSGVRWVVTALSPAGLWVEVAFYHQCVFDFFLQVWPGETLVGYGSCFGLIGGHHLPAVLAVCVLVWAR